MRNPLEALEKDTGALANHNKRHIHAIKRHLDDVVTKLEGHRQAGLVHLWRPAPDPAREMDVVVGVAGDLQEKLVFLGCYYCLQFLRMCLTGLDSLRLDLASPARERSVVEREFMLKMGTTFRILSGSYMRKLLELFTEGRTVPRYAIIGVGTKADLDDIDVGVLDDGSAGREALNDAIARMSTEMLRYATTLHFHISEHVGERGYTASISEYGRMLDNAVQDFVIITEMLGGALITGDAALFHDFQTSVVSRYYYRPGEDQKWHMGYLRGMLGEVRSLLGRPLATERIHPKDDGLRTIKGMLSVLKTIYQVGEVNAWQIIDALRRKIPEEAASLDALERALSFLEVFRFTYQLVVVQEEEIHIGDNLMRTNLDDVADILGYRQVGTIRPGTHLLVDYYEHLEELRRAAGVLMPRITDHLKETSVFADMYDPSYEGNVAEDFARRSTFFRGTTYWRDILEMLEVDDQRLLRRYIADLGKLSPDGRARVVAALADCADYALGTVLALITIVARNPACEGCDVLCDELSLAFRRKLQELPYAGLRLIELFYRRPRLVNRYLLSSGEAATDDLLAILNTEVWDPEMVVWRERLKNLIRVHTGSSRYFLRYLERAGELYQSCLTLLDDQNALKDISRGVLAEVEAEAEPGARKRRLGEYYDLEFLRIGLRTLSGAPAAETDPEFTQMADSYIESLFDICKREVDLDERFRVETHDLLAIFATGGLGREQAYDDDFDLMILLNTMHEDVRAYANRIVARMNAEIIKRGTLPHYRFADHFGHYVTTLAELEDFLEGDAEASFVDRSQLLEARMIVGTRRFADEYWNRIVRKHLFAEQLAYVKSMRREIESRHRHVEAIASRYSDVKEGIGGLRDILMLLLMYKMALKLRHPVGPSMLPAVARLDTAHREELAFLSEGIEFLRNLRNAYRLAVGAADTLRPRYFGIVASAMGLEYAGEPDAGERLLAEYEDCAAKVAETVDALAADLERALEAQGDG